MIKINRWKLIAMSTIAYDKYAIPPNRSFYPNLKADPVGSITDVLIQNLSDGLYEAAQEDFSRLLATIRNLGFLGKGIRYAAKQLHELRKIATAERNDRLAHAAARYANQLPKPIKESRTPSPGLEVMVA